MDEYEIFIEDHCNEMIEDLLGVVSIKSVKSKDEANFTFGKGVHEAMNRFVLLCQKLGLENVHRYDDYYSWVEIGNPALPMVGIICHIDVVDFDPTQWRHNPLGELSNGIIYGRGVSDDKGPLIMCLYAMKYIQDQKIPLRVRLIVGGDEESDFLCAKKYISNHEEMPRFGFIPDAKFPFIQAEKSLWNVTFQLTIEQFGYSDSSCLSGGIGQNSIPDQAQITIKGKDHHFRGETGHAANFAQADNAILQLITAIGPREDSLAEILVRHLSHQCLAIPYKDGEINLVPTWIQNNEDKIHVTFDMRIDESFDVYDVKRYLLKFLHLKEDDIVRENISQGYCYDLNHPVVDLLYTNYQECLHRSAVKRDPGRPMKIGGTTYAKSFPNCITYGPGFMNEHSYAHRADERISISSFKLAAYIYLRGLVSFQKLD